MAVGTVIVWMHRRNVASRHSPQPLRALRNGDSRAKLAAIMQSVPIVNGPKDKANVREEPSFMVACGPVPYPGSGVTVIVRDLNVRSGSRLQPSR